MATLRAICASEGMVEGQAYLFAPQSLAFEYKRINEDEIEREIQRVNNAYQNALEELKVLKERTQESLGKESAHIFRAQQTIVEDDSIQEEIIEYIKSDKVVAEVALTTIFDTYKSMFTELGDSTYNKERVLDLDDVYKRICRKLLGIEEKKLDSLPPKTIIVAEELFPSDTASMDKNNVIAFVTEKGGITSHVTILAKTLGIPAVYGVENVMGAIKDGDAILLRASSNTKTCVYLNPTEDEKSEYKRTLDIYVEYQKRIQDSAHYEPITSDGHKIIISANIGSPEDIANVKQHSGKSVGLFRTEFLFMQHQTLPDEEVQFQEYKKVAEAFNPGMVIIRTLDIGGDKAISSMELPQEANPFLGYRGIRIGLNRPEVLDPQLRAILRASAFGNIKILVPMISSIGEIKEVKQHIDDIKEDLKKENVDYDENIEIGIMIEIPSSLFIIDEFAQEVDFVSIGTNDLTQYLLATDRLNENVSGYYKPFHPSVFRAIKQVVDAMHKNNKWVGICGELGGMKLAIPALIGLGVDELSMSASFIKEALFITNFTNYSKAQQLVEKVLQAPTAESIEFLLVKAQNKVFANL